MLKKLIKPCLQAQRAILDVPKLDVHQCHAQRKIKVINVPKDVTCSSMHAAIGAVSDMKNSNSDPSFRKSRYAEKFLQDKNAYKIRQSMTNNSDISELLDMIRPLSWMTDGIHSRTSFEDHFEY